MRVAESIEIERTIEEVWHYAANPANDPAWCPKVRSVERLAPDRWLIRHKPVPLRPTAVLTVDQVAAEAPHRLVLREEDDASVFEVEYRLETTPSGTRFTQISAFRWKRLPMLIQRFLAAGVRHDIRRQLQDLKKTLETL